MGYSQIRKHRGFVDALKENRFWGNFYRPANLVWGIWWSFSQGSAILFTTGGGGDFTACITGHMTRGVFLQGGGPPSRGVLTWGVLHPGGWTDSHQIYTCSNTAYGQRAGSTHPIRMLSCFLVHSSTVDGFPRT